jgi:hypothetical protein
MVVCEPAGEGAQAVGLALTGGSSGSYTSDSELGGDVVVDIALAGVGPLCPADQVLVGGLHRGGDGRLIAAGADLGHKRRDSLRVRVSQRVVRDCVDVRHATQRPEVELAVKAFLRFF